MAFDEGLAERIRDIVRTDLTITEKKMFGGLAFLSGGYMFVGVTGDALMARVGPPSYDAALARNHVREMNFTGKPMKGYVFVDAPGFERDDDLTNWVEQCRRFITTLPPKKTSVTRLTSTDTLSLQSQRW
jgi:TfoX/Sxy family transcriptional regulator of competence genes